MAVEERTGKFIIKQIKNSANDNFRTIAFENDKQVGSTFDEDIADTLMAYPEGADITLSIDKSGQFWNIVGARLADKGDTSTVAARKPAPTDVATFPPHDLTYFMGYSARVIAAYLESSKEYVDTIENQDNSIEAIHKDIVFGAKFLMNKANE